MKVKSLIEALRSCDPDAEVLLAFQPHWPLETALKGIAVRKEFKDGAEGHGGDDEAPPAHPPRDGEAESDVVLVQGDFLRYGSKDAWDVARR